MERKKRMTPLNQDISAKHWNDSNNKTYMMKCNISLSPHDLTEDADSVAGGILDI